MSESFRILIIDDDDVDRTALRRAFTAANITVNLSEANNGKDGLNLMQHHHFDCIFLDYILPDKDGLAVLKIARAHNITGPIVMLTGHGDERLAVELIQAGATDYLPKSQLNAENLAHSLQHALRLHRAEIDRERAESELRLTNKRISDILESISDAFFALNNEWCVTYINTHAEAILQIGREKLILKNIWGALPRLPAWFRDGIHTTMNKKTPCTIEGYDKTLGVWIEAHVYPGQDGLSVYFRDITQRKETEERLSFLANFDALTGLPNRILLMDRLAQTLSRLPWNGRLLGILFVDLDRFKIINDTLGHNVGDHLLKEIARRLKDCVREGDTVARLGGDEFVILLADLAQADDTNIIATKIIESIAQPINLDNQELFVTASIGISISPTDTTDPNTLLKHADIAMYRAKEHGKNNFQFYTPHMDAKAARRLSLESSLRRALERQEFQVYYQPMIELGAEKIVSWEALVRWRHPEHGIISPADFLYLAEETGIIIPLGAWVLHQACAQAQTWRSAGYSSISVAVNLSNRQFRQPDLVRLVDTTLQTTGLNPDGLELELTEEIIMRSIDQAKTVLSHLRDMGVSLAIDDFGTGYSSLGHLKRFPIQTVKIDRSFITEVTTNTDDKAITEAIIAMAHKLKLQVVAEGVETAEQKDFLRLQGCDIVQGYFYSHPIPADQCAALLEKYYTKT